MSILRKVEDVFEGLPEMQSITNWIFAGPIL